MSLLSAFTGRAAVAQLLDSDSDFAAELQQRQADRTTQRRGDVRSRLAALPALRKELAKHDALLASARAKVAKCAALLAEAQEECNAPFAMTLDLSGQIERLQDGVERELNALADPAIELTRQWLWTHRLRAGSARHLAELAQQCNPSAVNKMRAERALAAVTAIDTAISNLRDVVLKQDDQVEGCKSIRAVVATAVASLPQIAETAEG